HSPAPRPRRSKSADWVPLAVLVLTSLALYFRLAAWVFMWSMALAIFLGFKWLTWRRAEKKPGLGLSLAYLFAWPGMDATAFLAKSPSRNKRWRPLWKKAFGPAAKMLVGAGLLWIAAHGFVMASPLVVGWIAMLGLVMFLHFGLFHLIALAWQHAGVDAQPL